MSIYDLIQVNVVRVEKCCQKFKNYVNRSGNFYNPVKVKDKFRYILPLLCTYKKTNHLCKNS